MQLQGNAPRLIGGLKPTAICTGTAYYSSGDPYLDFRPEFDVSDANGLDSPRSGPAGSTTTQCWTTNDGEVLGIVVQSSFIRGR